MPSVSDDDSRMYWLVNGAPDLTYNEWCERNREIHVAALSTRRKKVSLLGYTEKQDVIDRIEETRHENPFSGSSMEVYFLQERGAGAIKIGTSANVEKRIRSLGRIMPHELVLLVTMPGGHRIEALAHGLFKRARIRGEWFLPVPELLEYIAEIEWGKQARQRFDELVCPRCHRYGIGVPMRPAITDRGEVHRCWQCGAEYLDGTQVWPDRDTSPEWWAP